MAGRNPKFNAAKVRKNLRIPMQFGAPPLPGEQATFYFPTELVYNVPVDGDDVPFDPASTVTRNVPTPVKVSCAIEYQDAHGQAVDFGTVTPARLVTTLLDEDYEKVKGCTYVALRGEKYNYSHTRPPVGMFDIGLYDIVWIAEAST